MKFKDEYMILKYEFFMNDVCHNIVYIHVKITSESFTYIAMLKFYGTPYISMLKKICIILYKWYII